jgi:drug/metabolite transporter (DMT)-like permease
MALGLLAALAAALCYGVGTILQARGVQHVDASKGLDPGLMLRLAGSFPYVVGLLIDLIGFVLALLAVRALPLFVVQATLASSLAVTAILAQLLLRARLARAEWGGIVAVCAGLLCLALSAGHERPLDPGMIDRYGLIVCAAVLIVIAALVALMRRGSGATLLGAVAGLGFGLVGLSTRMLRHPTSLRGLVSDPASYALVLAGALGILAFATALQRGSVTRATAALWLCETVAPAVAGIVLLHDRPRPGLWLLAGIGFALTVAGALVLALFEHEELSLGHGAHVHHVPSPVAGQAMSGAGVRAGRKAPAGARPGAPVQERARAKADARAGARLGAAIRAATGGQAGARPGAAAAGGGIVAEARDGSAAAGAAAEASDASRVMPS